MASVRDGLSPPTLQAHGVALGRPLALCSPGALCGFGTASRPLPSRRTAWLRDGLSPSVLEEHGVVFRPLLYRSTAWPGLRVRTATLTISGRG